MEDGAVSAMYGVAHTVSNDIEISDLTHNIPPYDIWVASYRLYQTVKYWPKGTVFVSVVDPGVGSDRRSIACLTKSGHYIITPDNGSLSHIQYYEGIEKVIAIDEVKAAYLTLRKVIHFTGEMYMLIMAQDSLQNKLLSMNLGTQLNLIPLNN